jgi:hypothetical protein
LNGVSLQAIPAELRKRPQWVLWRREERDGKWTKAPWQARQPDRRASSSDSKTWATFTEAIAAIEEADGIGFVFAADDPFFGVDLDGELPEADQGAVLLCLDTYAERSVSGTGYHAIGRGRLPAVSRNRRGPIEVYDQGRFIVMTGEHVKGVPEKIEERQDELERVLDEFLPRRESAAAAVEPQPVDLADEELVERARRATNSSVFEQLWRGDISGYPSHSEADLALCWRLAFWTGRDPERIDRMFRASGLMREKWEREDYRLGTIEEALAGCPETYSPELRLGQNAVDAVSGFRAPRQRMEERTALLRQPYRTQYAPTQSLCEEEAGEPLTASDSEPDALAAFALPIRDFIERPREHREPLLGDADGRAVIGRRSLTLCGGLGGSGKTTFFIDLGLHLAAGVDYPPFTVPTPINVLMIENEGPEELFAEKLETRLASFPHDLKGRFDVCVFDWGGFSLAQDIHRDRLTNEIVEKGYDLIFGDPLDSLGIEGVGSPQDTRDFLALMKAAGLNKSVAWWLNTHPRKEETKEALNEISGAWGGKPDAVLLLRILEDDRTQVRFPKLRWAKRGKRPPILLGFDPETEAFTYLGDESEEERDYLAEIQVLVQNTPWRTPKEIAAPKSSGGIGASEGIVKKVLSEHPDVFESRTGDEAKELGRSPRATVWGQREVVAVVEPRT